MKVLDQSPEKQVLLSCARLGLDSVDESPVSEDVLESLDWDHLVEAVARHGLAPTLHNWLNGDCGFLSETIRASIAASYYQCAYRNLLAFDALKVVLSAFNDAGMKPILLKGGALILAVYQNPAVRPMADIDLLLRPEHFDSLVPVLCKIEEGTWRGYGFNNFVFCLNGVPIEIHRELLNYPLNYGTPHAEILRTALVHDLGGLKVLTPSPTTLLFHLCFHNYYHSFSQLLRFRDIAMLLDRYGSEIDWAKIRSDAENYGISRIVGYNLSMVERLFGLQLPVSAPTIPRDDLGSLPSWLPAAPTLLDGVSASGEGLPYTCRLISRIEGIGPEFRALLRVLLPADNSLAARYDFAGTSRPLWVYKLLRLYQMCADYVPSVSRMFAKKPRG